jgi:hypothetical protein
VVGGIALLRAVEADQQYVAIALNADALEFTHSLGA